MLTVSETRTDEREAPWAGATHSVTSESETTLWGRVASDPGGGLVAFFADSLRYRSRRPFVFETFVSADTAYHEARGGRGSFAGDDDGLAAMRACLFGEAVLAVVLSGAGAPGAVTDRGHDCGSGEYDRIGAPVTLAAFFVRRADRGRRWRETRAVPTFSGVGFHPRVEWLYRAVDARGATATVTLAADSTVEDLEVTMPNGERVTIVRDRIRLGGTLILDRDAGPPAHGEVRVAETVRFVRPRSSGMVVTKDGRYTIRLQLEPNR